MGNCKSGSAAGFAHVRSRSGSREKLLPKDLRLVAKGGEKAVHSCTYGGKNAIVAVSLGPECHERVLNESLALKAINAKGGHPHIITLLSSGAIQGYPYLVLEAVEPLGRDLNRLSKEYGDQTVRVPSSITARIFQQLISALKFLHKMEVIHRDLKTENVLVSTNLKAKLIDFGASSGYGTHQRYSCAYMAPEVLEGREQDGAVDLWGLGVILHQMYQFTWHLLAIKGGKARFKPFMPSSHFPMMKDMEDAMCNLLRLRAGDRWTLKTLSESPWLVNSIVTKTSSFRCSDTRRGTGFDGIVPETPSTTATTLPLVSEPSCDSSGCAFDNLTSMRSDEGEADGIPGQVKSSQPTTPTCSRQSRGESESTYVVKESRDVSCAPRDEDANPGNVVTCCFDLE